MNKLTASIAAAFAVTITMKNFTRILAAITVTALTLAAGAASAQTIRVTLQLPETHPLGVNLNAWKTCVEGESDLRVQIFPSAQYVQGCASARGGRLRRD